MNSSKVLGLCLGLLVTGIVLSACHDVKPATPPATVVVTGCEYFRPISAKKTDDTETITQIIAHNYAYQLACSTPNPGPKKA